LALQAPLLALLMVTALGQDRLVARVPPRPSSAALVLAVLVLIATWLGMSNAAREIAKEAAIYRRERAIGLSTSAYVASKATVLSSITVAQTTVLVLLGLSRQGLSSDAALIEPAVIELVVGVGLTGVAAVSLGLCISALASTPDRAMGILPVILIFQLIVSGGFKEMPERPGLRELSYLSSAQWGFSAAAATVDLNALQILNDCLAEVGLLTSRSEALDKAASLARCALADPDLTEGLIPVEDALDLTVAESECVAELAKLESTAIGRLNGAELDSALECTVAYPSAAVAALPDGAVSAERLAARAGAVNDHHPFRFWNQTRGDWLVDVGFLMGLTGAGLIGTWVALRRRDRKLP
jgi:hypothetical protein